MKKLFIFSLAALLTLAFGSAYAQAPVGSGITLTASGYWDMEYLLGRNATSAIRFNYGAAPAAAFDRSFSWMKTRGRLLFNVAAGKEVNATVYFEIDADPYGGPPGSTAQGTLQRGTAGYWSADRSAVEVKWLFFDFAVPVIPVPITVRVGQQGLGFRSIVQSNDGAGITASMKLDPVTIDAVWAKALEGDVYKPDDSDMYALRVRTTLGKLTVGGYGMYFNFNTNPLTWTATGGVGATQRADFWYLGAYADGKVGPVNINFDFVLDKGKVSSPTPGILKSKYNGWATKLNVDYPWDKFNFGAGIMYMTGDDKNKAADKKYHGFVAVPASEGAGGTGEAIIFYGAPDVLPSGGLGISGGPTSTFASAGDGGSWWAKIYAKAQITPSYKVHAKLFYIGDTTKNGDTWGTLDGDHKFIGWEFDLINSIQLYKNLKFEIAGGVMGVGNALKFVDNHGDVRKPKTPWAIVGDLMYTF